MRPPSLVQFSPKELLKLYHLTAKTAIQACLREGGLSVAVHFEACLCSTSQALGPKLATFACLLFSDWLQSNNPPSLLTF